MTLIRHVIVAIPVRDEEALLPRCLDALEVACAHLMRHTNVVVDVVLALDGCTDRSEQIARSRLVRTRVLAGVGVGIARDAAVRDGLAHTALSPDEVWIACTDADTYVPPTWLARQLDLADSGVDLVIGTVEPINVDNAAALAAWHDRHQLREGHPYVHGANLGMRASTFYAAGGFQPVAIHEDVGIVQRAQSLGAHWVATDTTRVTTSGRKDSRVDGGFATYLSALDSEAG